MPKGFPRELTSWFLRKAGLARVSTFACAAGLSLASVTGARADIALPGLALSLLLVIGGVLARLLLPGRRFSLRLAPDRRLTAYKDRSCSTARRPSSVVVFSLVLVGLFAGYLVGSVRVAVLLESELANGVGNVIQAELVITGQVRSNGGWQSAPAEVRKVLHQEAETERSSVADAASHEVGKAAVGENVLLELAPAGGSSASLEESSSLSLNEGMIAVVTATLEEPERRLASGFDQSAFLRNQGIRMVLRAGVDDVTILGHRGGISGLFDRLRTSARAHLSLGPDSRVDEVLQGVVMGDTVGIDKGWTEVFRRAGTAHMLSVSGLHVASIAAIMIGLARLARAPRGLGFLLAAMASLLLIPFVGASPPVIRSTVMIVIVLAGRWFGRGRDQWQILALAAAAVLALNPFALYDVGFQLSFAAFAGMVALAGPLSRRLTYLPGSVGSDLAVSVAASLGTAPVSLMVFGRTSLVAPLANILVVPALPVVTGLGMASVFLGFLWSGFSTALDTLASLPVTWTVLVSRLFAVAPVLDVKDLGRALASLLVGAMAVPVAMAAMGRTVTNPLGVPLPFFRRGLRWVRGRRPRSHRIAGTLAVTILLASMMLGGAVYPSVVRGFETAMRVASGNGWPEQTEVRILDVGQGNAVLVRTTGHHTLLFDAGPSGCGLARQLHVLGVHSIDVIVVSHPHADHFAGLLEAIDELKIDTFVDPVEVSATLTSNSRVAEATAKMPATTREAVEYLGVRRRLVKQGCRYARAESGSLLEVDGVKVRFFAPARSLTMTDGAEPWLSGQPTGDQLNASSLVAVVSIGNIDVLIPGDAEADVLETYALPPVELLVVPHHGSKGAVTTQLLDKLRIEGAFVSVGEKNSFGHPDADTMSILRSTMTSLWRTDQCGWVSCGVDNDKVVITTERDPGL